MTNSMKVKELKVERAVGSRRLWRLEDKDVTCAKAQDLVQMHGTWVVS